MDEDKPPERPTTKIDQTAIAIEGLKKAMENGFALIRADVGLVSNDLSLVKESVRIVTGRVDILETRAGTTSERVRGQSAVDLAHEAKIAAEIEAREALAKKVDSIDQKQETQLAILSRLDKVASNPTVKIILTVVGMLAGQWLLSHGVKP